MSRKHPYHSNNIKPPEADDLQIIIGIGPAVESRLHRVGIFTFAQLSTLSPADIAASLIDLPGITAERISRQDWIGQARELISASALIHQEGESEVEASLQDYVPFAAESQESPGEFPNEQQVQAVEAAESASLVDEQLESEPPAAGPLPIAAESPPVGKLRLVDLDTLSATTLSHQCIFPSGQPFGVRLTLDFTDVALPVETFIRYTASVHARQLGYRERQLISETRGNTTLLEKLTVVIDEVSLPYGAYLLEATVVVEPQDIEPLPQTDLVATIRGGILQVY